MNTADGRGQVSDRFLDLLPAGPGSPVQVLAKLAGGQLHLTAISLEATNRECNP